MDRHTSLFPHFLSFLYLYKLPAHSPASFTIQGYSHKMSTARFRTPYSSQVFGGDKWTPNLLCSHHLAVQFQKQNISSCESHIFLEKLSVSLISRVTAALVLEKEMLLFPGIDPFAVISHTLREPVIFSRVYGQLRNNGKKLSTE